MYDYDGMVHIQPARKHATHVVASAKEISALNPVCLLVC